MATKAAPAKARRIYQLRQDGVTVELAKRELSYQVFRNGQFLTGISRRRWEPCIEHEGALHWARSGTKEELKKKILNAEDRRVWRILKSALPGPAANLERRIADCMEDISSNRNEVLTRPAEKLPNRFRGGGDYYTRNTRLKHGRPRNLPPVYDQPQTPLSVGDLELGSGTRQGMRLAALDTAAMFDLAPAAKQLNLTRRSMRELYHEYRQALALHEADETQRERLARWELWSYRPELYEPKLTRTYSALEIAAESDRLREPPLPRHPVGACLACVNNYRKQTVRLHLGHCPHYSQTFSLDGGIVRRQPHSQERFRADIREAAPRSTLPAQPAWPGHIKQGRRTTRYSDDHRPSYAAQLALRYLRSSGDQTLDRDYRQIIGGTDGAAMMEADYSRKLRMRAA